MIEMINTLSRIFRIDPEDLGIVFGLGIFILANSIAQQISEIVSISGFLDSGGVNRIPIVWLIVMTLIILATGAQSLVVDRFERLKFMRWMVFGLAIIYAILRLMFVVNVPDWLIYGLLNILAELQWLFFALIFWILASDMFNLAQAKKLFPLIAGWGFVGDLIGIGISAVAPNLFTQLNLPLEELLSLNAVIYVFLFVLTLTWLNKYKIRKTRQKPETMRETLTEGWDFIREIPAFRYLTVAIVAINIAMTATEFRFLVVSDSYFTTLESYQRFFSFYRLGLTMASFLMLTFISSALINKVELKNAFFFMPAALILGLTWILSIPGIISAVSGMLIPKFSQKTVDEPVRKTFQSLVPEERRGRVSLFLDSYMFAGGTMVGSALILTVITLGALWNSANSHIIYLSMGLLAALIATWAIYKMRVEYDSSMLNWRLKRRQRRGLTGVMKKLDL